MNKNRFRVLPSLSLTVALALFGCGDSSGDDAPSPDTQDMASADATTDVGADVSTEVDSGFDAATADSGSDRVSEVTTETSCNVSHPDHTVGLVTCLPEAHDGYTLFAPISATTVYLIDMLGRVVHSWDTDHQPGNVVYLLENGHLLLTGQYSPSANPRMHGGGEGGVVQEIGWDGTVLWSFEYSTDEHRQHHDVEMLPDGNVLMVAWEYKSTAEAVAQGRISARARQGLWPDTIIEVEPAGADGGEIVWEYVSPVAVRGSMSQGEQPGEGPGRNNSVFRAYRYDRDYAGLHGRDLTPGDVLEQ